METALVAFGSALLGVIGGFGGALYLEGRRIHRRRVGYVRALASELRQNVLTAVLTREVGKVVGSDFSSDTWTTVRYDIGQFAGPDLFEALNTSYMTLHGIRRIGGELGRGRPLDDEVSHAISVWEEGARKALNQLAGTKEAREVGVAEMHRGEQVPTAERYVRTTLAKDD